MITGDSVYAVRGLQFGQCPSQVIAVKDMIVVVGQFREIYILKSQSTGVAPVQADFEVSVSPNPAYALTYADIHLSRASFVSMRVFTLEGRSVSHHGLGFLPEGKHRMPIPLEGLASGIYVLQVQTEKGVVTKKFVVQ